AKLTADDSAASDSFGVSVSISGNTAIIGSPFDDDAGSGSGSAYVFVRNAGVWTQRAKLTADDATAGELFSYPVSISGDTVVIGARQDNDAGTDSGSAYIFLRTADTWTQQAKFTAADAVADDLFGNSVSISGDTAVIGAWRNDDAGLNSGSVYVFSTTVISSDCQADGIPDDCQLDGNDCNANGIPDECDGFIDTTPPVINCEIAPAPEDDSEGDGNTDGSSSGWTENPVSVPNDQIDTIIQTGFGLINPPGGRRHEIPIADVGHDGPIMILFDATDDCGEVTLSAIIDIGCMQIPVENGTLIAFECNEGDDSGDCEAEEDDGILEIEAASAILIVTATDESGNTATCEITLCTPPDDSGDDNEGDAGAASEGRLAPRPKARGPRLEEGGSTSR
ncbi:MAG: FG-GAP repeat protein, partial [Phycisphaerae bacterium]